MKRYLYLFLAVAALVASAPAQDMNTRWKHGSDRTKCEDLQITSSDFEIARTEQTFTVEGKQDVNLEGSRNGGVYVSGWDQPNFQVTACKAGFAEKMDRAKELVAGVNVAASGGKITTNGPEEKEGERWVVHYIIRTPHGANLKASTYNGPASVRDADGKIELYSRNGPVSVKHFKGDVIGETTNGPVDYVGNGGNINLHTTNGPVNVHLESAEYSGEMSATTRNGPVTLALPNGFNTAFLVEGGWGPMSCRSAVCDKAHQVRERGNQRIEFGDNPKIKASTRNGPITVGTNDDDL